MDNLNSVKVKGKPVVVHPFFLKAGSLPKDVTDYELLIQAEKIAGYGRAKIAQKIDGLWRIHMSDKEARYKVLTMKMTVRGKVIETFDRNPFIFVDDNGQSINTTKLSLTNLPVSVNDEELLFELKKTGVEILSDLKYEHVRSPVDKTLIDRFWNANRFLIIKVPDNELPNFLKVGKFRVYLKYRERFQQMKCHNCQQTGHRAAECKNESVCTDCNNPGHQKGDAICSKNEVMEIVPEFQLEKNDLLENLDVSKEPGELSSDNEESDDSEEEDPDDSTSLKKTIFVTKEYHVEKNLAYLKSLSSSGTIDDDLVFPEIRQNISHTVVRQMSDETPCKVSEFIAAEIEKEIQVSIPRHETTKMSFADVVNLVTQRKNESTPTASAQRRNESTPPAPAVEDEKISETLSNTVTLDIQGKENNENALNKNKKVLGSKENQMVKDSKKKGRKPNKPPRTIIKESVSTERKDSDKGKTPNQDEPRATARKSSRGSIDFYVKHSSKVRDESRGSKRSLSPARSERRSKNVKTTNSS